MTEAAFTQAVVEACGIDPFTARQKLQRGLPQVLTPIDAAVVPDVLASLDGHGIRAFAPTTEDLAAVPEPIRAKRLVRAEGAPEPMYLVEPWKGQPAGLRCDDVFLIVRARVDASVTKVVTASPLDDLGSSHSSVLAGWGGVGTGVDSAFGETPVTARTTTHNVRHIVDLYTTRGVRVRCDSEKFNFDVLGKIGMTDLENSDRLALLLADQCRRAQIAADFKSFRCAGDIITSSRREIGRTAIDKRDDAPVFEFYSAWTYCYHVHLLSD